MFSKIVLALDGSEASERAIPVVRELASAGTARIDVVHVRELMVGRAGGLPLHADEDALTERVRAQAKDLAEAGYDVHVHVESTVGGGPAHVIAEVAQRVGADVIVTGTRGHSALAGLVVGSVTQRLLHIAVCPVLSVPAGGASAAVSEADLAVAAAR
jgi:nucleotide-binding universal stress UspA family protein